LFACYSLFGNNFIKRPTEQFYLIHIPEDGLYKHIGLKKLYQ